MKKVIFHYLDHGLGETELQRELSSGIKMILDSAFDPSLSILHDLSVSRIIQLS